MMHFCSGETEKKMEVRWVDGEASDHKINRFRTLAMKPKFLKR